MIVEYTTKVWVDVDLQTGKVDSVRVSLDYEGSGKVFQDTGEPVRSRENVRRSREIAEDQPWPVWELAE